MVGRQPLLNRPDATIGEVREVEGGILLAVRWESVPFMHDETVLGMTPVSTTWLRCTEQEPDVVFELIRGWFARYHQNDDRRIADAEPPADVACGTNRAPDSMTQAQRDTLFDLARQSPSMCDAIMRALTVEA